MPSDHIPPRWLYVALVLCLSALFAGVMGRPELGGAPGAAALGPVPAAQAAVSTPEPTPEPAPAPTPTPEPTPEPTPTPTPEPDWSQPVPETAAVDPDEWFADAVFIGDSRTDGFRLFSGVTPQAQFLVHTGISVYEVMAEKPVIRQGEEKISILAALAQQSYGKVYISLGVNELGYKAPQDFAETYALLIDAVRACQADAVIYVQSIIPVNTAKCKANDQRYYVTNERIAAYNEALFAMAAEKKVRLIDLSPALTDDTGEVPSELSADGVHFKKQGYILWRDYLTTHTGF